jgi:hypothetical protein
MGGSWFCAATEDVLAYMLVCYKTVYQLDVTVDCVQENSWLK